MEKKSFQQRNYEKINILDLILLSIYLIKKKGETCTFEKLVAECFLNFPKTFSFSAYPQWPDSLKLDRPLRTLRQKGLIIGGVGGKYSPGEFLLTKFGEKKAREIEKNLSKDKVSTLEKSIKKISPRSIDEKIISQIKNSFYYQEFLKEGDKIALKKVDFLKLIKCTPESPIRIINQNLSYLKNIAKLYKENKLLSFIYFLERTFLKN